ncbi:MAG: hypothetical protein JWN01_889 [Patescibacteria group bacterium]|nr:hypothetical protein [Patescibacteria group bacterium]
MVLVFDMGASRTRVALADKGKVGQIVRLDTDRSAGGFAKFLSAVEEVKGKHKIRAMAGSFPGQIEGENGVLTVASNLPKWIGLPVRQRLEQLVGCPVHILNDVAMGGLGEAHYGAGTTAGVMAYFTVSTGVNAVRIVDGEIDETISRYEVGQQLMAPGDAGDDSGGFRTLEYWTGGAAMEQRLGKRPQDLRKDKKIWQAEARHLALGLYNTLLHWTPDMVVFGGSMMRDIDLQLVGAELKKMPKVLPDLPRLEYAKLGDMAGLQGGLVWLDLLRR